MQRRAFLATAAIATLAAGCAKTPGGPPSADQWKPLLRLAVSLGVDRLLVENRKAVPMVVQSLRIVQDVLDRGTFTSVSEVGTLLRRVVPWDKLDASAKLMIEALVAAIADELKVLAERYKIPDDVKLVLVQEIIGWALEVAERHEERPVPAVRKVAGL